MLRFKQPATDTGKNLKIKGTLSCPAYFLFPKMTECPDHLWTPASYTFLTGLFCPYQLLSVKIILSKGFQ